MTDDLSRPLQENILTLAIYNDTACKIIRATVPLNLFTTKLYRTIVSKIYDYVDQYGLAPRDHLADELESLFNVEEQSEEAELIARILADAENLHGEINEKYVLDTLGKFKRQQTLKIGIIEAHEKIQQGELDEAEAILQKSMRVQIESFDAGITLPTVVRKLQDRTEWRDCIATGIKEIDDLQLGPARKELHVFVGPPKKGKSWWLDHLTRRALMQRWKGILITLEMPAEQHGQRILQGISASTTRPIEHSYRTILETADGKLEDIVRKEVTSPNLYDKLSSLTEKIEELRFGDRLLIKEFPTGALTIPALEAYLDLLVSTIDYQPDFIAIDYPKLMKLDPKNYRLELGDIFVQLRRLAHERNLAMLTVHQTNRPGADAALVGGGHMAEDFSINATADAVFTYNQTHVERQWNLARLFVSAARTEKDQFVVLLTQDYASGQFVLQSYRMTSEYEAILKEKGIEEPDDT